MKNRNEIDEKYKADLSLIYKNESEMDEDVENIKKLTIKIEEYKNKVLENSNTLLNVLKLMQDYSVLTDRVIVYTYFKYDLDMTDDSLKEKLDTFEDFRIMCAKKLSFVSIELKKITLKKWNSFKEENNSLEVYDYYIKEIIRGKKHNLKDSDEKFFTNLYPILGSNENAYTILTNADFKASDVIVNGKPEKLTESTYYKFMVNPDRDVRKNAYKNLMEFYKNHKHTIAELYKMNVKENNTLASISKYNNAFEQEMDSNNLKTSIYTNLVEFVKGKISFNKKYISLLKKDLGLEKMYPYDSLYNKHNSREYSYEECIEIASKSLEVLGSDYISKFNKGITSRWIDVYPSEHKNSSQYSISASGVVPFIHLNFNSTFEDINTIVHEMGHSIHKIYSEESNHFIYSDPTTLATETAAIVNEMLLANYILDNSKNKEEQLFIVHHLLSMIRSTIFSQTSLAEFELICHIKDSNYEPLTTESLNELYSNISSNYASDEIEKLEESSYAWMSIPHIFQGGGFYVYKYSLGLMLASGIVYGILNNKDNMKEKYINFLKSGSSKPDYVLFKELGFDINKTKYMENSFKMFEKYLEIYEELLK